MAKTSSTETTTSTAEAEPTGVLGTFGIRGDLFLAQLVNFLIVMVVLWKFVYKPMIAMLDAREQKIAQSMKDVDAIATRVKASEDERQAAIVATRKETQGMIDIAIRETEVRKNEMLEAARNEVERVIAKGKETLVAEREASLLALRKDVVDIAVRAAAKIVTDGMDEKKSQSLAEEVVRKLT